MDKMKSEKQDVEQEGINTQPGNDASAAETQPADGVKSAENIGEPALSAGEHEPDGFAFGLSNEKWNALLAVMTFTQTMVAYVLVGMMAAYFKANLLFVSQHLPVPPLVTFLGNVFRLDLFSIGLFAVLLVAAFYALNRFIQKHTKIPSFFFITFFSQFLTTLFLILVLAQFLVLYSMFGGR